MSSVVLRAAFVLVGGTLLVLSGSAASGQTGPSPRPSPRVGADAVLLSWQVDSVANLGGFGGAVDWLRTGDPSGPIYTAGASQFSLGESRWALGRVGATIRPTPRLLVGGGTSLGRGDANGTGFGYLSLRGELAYRLRQRVVLTFHDEYLNVASSQGNLVKAGGLLQVSRWMALTLAYARSTGGNLNTDFAVGRVDVTAGFMGLFAGGAAGRTIPEVFDRGRPGDGRARRLRNGFFGATVPVSRARLTMAFDQLALGDVDRYTMRFTLNLPIRQ